MPMLYIIVCVCWGVGKVCVFVCVCVCGGGGGMMGACMRVYLLTLENERLLP